MLYTIIYINDTFDRSMKFQTKNCANEIHLLTSLYAFMHRSEKKTEVV